MAFVRRHRVSLVLLVLGVVVATLVGYRIRRQQAAAVPRRQVEIVVGVTKPVRKDLDVKLSYTADVLPSRQVAIFSKVSGYIKRPGAGGRLSPQGVRGEGCPHRPRPRPAVPHARRGDGDRQPRHLLKPGMYARVELVIDRHPGAILVPGEAVVSDGEKAAVFVVRDSIVERRAVTTGVGEGTAVEITQGLRGDEQVIVEGKELVREKQKVRVAARSEVAK
jgi:hypothetical protein